MNKLMMEQFKSMAVILAVFFISTAAIGHFDPTIQDDLTLNATDEGHGCDAVAHDGVFTACIPPEGPSGVWVAQANAYSKGQLFAQNATAFVQGSSIETVDQVFVAHPSPSLLSAFLPSIFPPPRALSVEYVAGPTEPVLRVHSSDSDRVTFTLDNTTRFYVELPVSIPLINVKRIYGSNWWFIFVALLAGLVLSAFSGMKAPKPVNTS